MKNSISNINGLLAENIPESLTLDYKQMLPGKTDEDKKEFAIDVASFMNAMGGEIIYGIKEVEKVPVEITAINSIDRDAEERRLNQVLLDTIEPRGEYKFEWIDADGGGSLLSLTIPPSANLPHRVNYKGRTHFFVRDSVGKHPMSMDELRNKFRSFNIAKSNFNEEVVQLSDTFSGGAVFLKNKIFTNCVLNGPANVMFSGKMNFRSMSSVEIVVVQKGSKVQNAVLLDECTVEDCDINNVTLYLISEQYDLLPDAMKAGIPLLAKI